MKRPTLEIVAIVMRGLDLAALIAAFVLAAGLTARSEHDMAFGELLAIRVSLLNLLVFVTLVGVWGLILSSFGLYRTELYRGKWREPVSVAAAVCCCVALLWITHVVFNIELVGPRFVLDFFAAAIALALAARLATRFVLRRRRRNGRHLRYLLIVGTGARAVELARHIEQVPEIGYHLLGFVDDAWSGSEACRQTGYPMVTNLDGFADFIAQNVVDEVIVCMPVKSFYERCSQILARCEEQGITARFISDVFRPTVGHSYIQRFGDGLMVTIDTGGMRGWAVAVKRLIDIVAACVLLVALSPLFIVIALLIKRRSPGSVFFVQERLGLNKRRFCLYKFRTMVANAEAKVAELEHLNEASGPAFKIKHDPRVTGIGRILRQTSLDELPQLFNVLKGDMSLVGPRPLPVRDYKAFNTDWHRRRFSVKPGITCLWQVMGRHSVSFERWMELDMQYIDQWSLLLDLRILLKTIPAVMRGSGAY